MDAPSSHFVAIASIAAELSAVMEIADEISLAAANAKAIAFRAGEQARGFQPITDFINELAKNTISLIDEVNDQALLLYQLTIKEQLLNNTIQQFDRILTQSRTAKFHDSLQPVTTKLKRQQQTYRLKIHNGLSRLQFQLAEIMHPARAARVIAANSRIEASQAGEYLASLQTVAETVEHAANIIHKKVRHCQNTLSPLEYLLT